MRTLRDIFYVNGNTKLGEYLFYGMTFQEFLSAIPRPIENLLLLRENYEAVTRLIQIFGVIEGSRNVQEYAQTELYFDGPFCFVDYLVPESANLITPQEASELLYLSYVQKPLYSPFFEHLQNQYVYLGEDDGWRCRLFCCEQNDFGRILANKVQNEVQRRFEYPCEKLDEQVECALFKLVDDGLIIDFSAISCLDNDISIPVYTVGKFEDMDYVYHNREKLKARAAYEGWLEYSKQKWRLFDL